MEFELDTLNEELPDLDWVDIAARGRRGASRLTPLPKAIVPRNLRKLKAELASRWGIVQLIDILKEAVLRSGCLEQMTSRASRGE